MTEFEKGLQHLINCASRENGSNTPDHILANYLANCLRAYEVATNQRDAWYGMSPYPGWTVSPDVPPEPCEDPEGTPS